VLPDIPPRVAAAVAGFQPDAVLMSGWNFAGYRRIARAQRARGAPVIAAADNVWRGTLRQQALRLVAPWRLHRTIDAAYVCGERQLEFARKLGFTTAFPGLYAADIERFRGLPPLAQRPNRFLFVGRLIERKGLVELLDGYRRYRAAVAAPMALCVAGRGPLQALCESAPGVQLPGFQHPDALAGYFAQGQCLVLPSHEENWGVVLHEAAAAGLPLIASHACGASVAFLRDGANGFLIQPEAAQIAHALHAFHDADRAARERLSEHSLRLGWTWSPELQAAHFMGRLRLLARAALGSPTAPV
jgi:glycosyltransferase involved in cell wall biosynthesis